MIQICVARADLFLCAVAALPWGRILAGLAACALLIVGARRCHRIRAPDDAEGSAETDERGRSGGENA